MGMTIIAHTASTIKPNAILFIPRSLSCLLRFIAIYLYIFSFELPMYQRTDNVAVVTVTPISPPSCTGAPLQIPI
jgi:hypothetical protein